VNVRRHHAFQPGTVIAIISEDLVMDTLLTAIIAWLAVEFGLPATANLPKVELVSNAKMTALRLGPLSDAPIPGKQRSRTGRQAGLPEVEALYHDASRTIFLNERWTGATPVELSVLVHEMVHHLQNEARLKYECPQAREELAYAAQDRWLAQSGLSLIKEFKLNALTLLVRTKCMH
jgi:hypothetical protein